MNRNSHHVFLGVLLVVSFFTLWQHANAFTITDSKNISVSATVGSLPLPDTGGSSVGGTQSGVRFSGLAYPQAIITVQKNLQTIATITAKDSGGFSVFIPGNGWGLFTLFATDIDGRISPTVNFPTVLYTGHLTDISSIRFAPTLVADKSVIKKGEYIRVSGMAAPFAPLVLRIQGFEQVAFRGQADADGRYLMRVPVEVMEGDYFISVRYSDESAISRRVRLIVSTNTLFQDEAAPNIPGDCTVDYQVTMIDFSIMRYWFGKKNPPACVDLDKDGTVTLVDFSILAYYWKTDI